MTTDSRYFLHIFVPGSVFAPRMPDVPDNVACVEVLAWEVLTTTVGPGAGTRLRVEARDMFAPPFGAKRGRTPSWRLASAEWTLVPGVRAYVVEHRASDMCWAPNGEIIWRWDEVRHDNESDASRASA